MSELTSKFSLLSTGYLTISTLNNKRKKVRKRFSTKMFTGKQKKFYNVLTVLKLIAVHNEQLKLASPISG